MPEEALRPFAVTSPPAEVSRSPVMATPAPLATTTSASQMTRLPGFFNHQYVAPRAVQNVPFLRRACAKTRPTPVWYSAEECSALHTLRRF